MKGRNGEGGGGTMGEKACQGISFNKERLCITGFVPTPRSKEKRVIQGGTRKKAEKGPRRNSGCR